MKESKHFLKNFQPQHYDIYLDIDRAMKQIKGKTTIEGNAKASEISLHQKYLKITNVTVNDQKVDFTVDQPAEAFHFAVNQPGTIQITVDYTAPLTDTMMGIYPSYYEVNGEKKQIIGTQFETTAARQAFPGVDEPEAKATFNLAIKFDEKPGETIIANMPENHVKDGVHYFDETKRMSTYLIAFAFGDLQSKQTTTKSGVKIGVFATKAHQSNELDFALDIAKRSIEFYEDFYQTPYPLPHSWQLALPDFSAGAMENWGLVTYREAYLLMDPQNSSLALKQEIATVIAHELAHQWFGDLVTMKWWDDLWLNESFANMMEYVATDALEPNWKIWDLFQTAEVPSALSRDAIDGVQSVHVQVEDPAEIDAIFDSAIVYAKGARMLVMVRALLGDDALRKGLKQYFDTHQYHNATGADLWRALGEASGMDIGKIMNSWLEQPGYPVVKAEIDHENLVLSQKQFFIGESKDQGRLWQIPLNSNYSAAPKIMSEKRINLGNYQELRQKEQKPFKLNDGNNSHFIIKYDETLLNDLLKHITNLDEISQLQILQDLRLLAEAQEISYAKIVPLLSQFADSSSSIVIESLYNIANKLKNFVTPNSSSEQQLQKLFDQLSEKQVQELGWQPKVGENNDDELKRPLVLKASLYAKNSTSIGQAHEIFAENQNDLAALPATTRSLILSNEMINFGSLNLFNRLFEAYKNATNSSFKNALGNAITSTTDPELIKQILANFKNAEIIKPQDLRQCYYNILKNPYGEQLAWDWLRNNWQWLEDTVGGDMEFSTFITVSSFVFHTRKRLNEFKSFFEPKLNTPGLTREIKMDIRSIASKVSLIESQQAEVIKAITQCISN